MAEHAGPRGTAPVDAEPATTGTDTSVGSATRLLTSVLLLFVGAWKVSGTVLRRLGAFISLAGQTVTRMLTGGGRTAGRILRACANLLRAVNRGGAGALEVCRRAIAGLVLAVARPVGRVVWPVVVAAARVVAWAAVAVARVLRAAARLVASLARVVWPVVLAAAQTVARWMAAAGRMAADRAATIKLGRAVQLAALSGNDATSKLLVNVVDVQDAASGTVRLKTHVSDADEMALDTRSTKTIRVQSSSPMKQLG
jgi:hypothetical protein